MSRIIWICLLLILSGCQQALTRNGASATEPSVPSATSVDAKLQNLIDFSSRFQTHALADQRVLCAEMRQELARDQDPWIGWYLATAISQVADCGEPEEAIGLIQRMLDQRFLSREVSWLAYYQIRLLRRQQVRQQQLQAAVAEQRRLQARWAQAAEAKQILESQLRDLKRIETSINQRLDEKQ